MKQSLLPCHGPSFNTHFTKQFPPTPGQPISEKNGILIVTTVAIFFILVLFAFLLFLYARLFCRRSAGRYSRRSDESFGSRRLNFAPEDPLVLRGDGLDPSIIANLPTFVYKSENFKGGSLQCAVCLCELKEDEKARQLPKCNHSFHVDCIDMWFHSHSTCPLCRASVHPDCAPNSVESASARQISGSNSMAEDRVSSPHSVDIEIHTYPIPQHAERAQTSAIAEKETIQICRE